MTEMPLTCYGFKRLVHVPQTEPDNFQLFIAETVLENFHQKNLTAALKLNMKDKDKQ